MSGGNDRLLRLGTAAVSDALDRFGLRGALPGIRRLAGAKAAGPAFTVSYEPATESSQTVGDFLDDVPPGSVVVLDNKGRIDCSVWGGIMSWVARHRGIGGTLVHGACRDIDSVAELGYPLFALASVMVTGKGRVHARAVQVPVGIGGTIVAPGDLVLADGTGAVTIPAGWAEQVVGAAEEIEAAESAIVRMVAKGVGLADARAAMDYHRLQQVR